MVAASLLTASVVGSNPQQNPQWIQCDDVNERVQIEYEGEVFSGATTGRGTIYFEPVDGWENSPGSNFLFSSDQLNLTQADTVEYTFSEWIWVNCENGNISVSNHYGTGRELQQNSQEDENHE